jgi:hypothetical protein
MRVVLVDGESKCFVVYRNYIEGLITPAASNTIRWHLWL